MSAPARRPRWPAFLAAVLLGGLAAALIVFLRQPTAPTQPTPNSKPQTPNSHLAAPNPEPGTRNPEPVSPASALRPDFSALETLAATDHETALARALSETDPVRLHRALSAALRGWASKDIRAAARWALTQDRLNRDVALAAVFHGGAVDAEAAIACARELAQSHPPLAIPVGTRLVHGLNAAGHHRQAAAYALSRTDESARIWLTAAYTGWAKADPRQALFSAEEIASPELRTSASRSVYATWADTNPAELASIAIGYPPGEDRRLALTAALRAWIDKDPAAAADWIAKQKFSPEMEAALEE